MAIELTGADTGFESPDSFERLGLALDELTDDGHVQEGEDVAAAASRRVRISRTYLWLLGYLEKDDESESAGPKYRDAVARFRADADLGPGVELGDDGWLALCELAQFDSVTDVDRWLGATAELSALERAAHVRLFSYGLIKDRPSHKTLSANKLRKYRKRVNDALDDFRRVASRLRLVDDDLEPGLNKPLLELLFAHSSLSRRIRWRDDGYDVFDQHPDLPLSKSKASKLTKSFVGNLALVELWLLGYDVRPGKFREGAAHTRVGDGTLHGALKKFAEDRELRGVNTDQIKVAKWFFDEAHAISEADPGEAGVSDDELNGILASSKKRTEFEKSYKSLGARLIDGIKRAVGWVVSLFRKVVRAVKQLIRNIARVVCKGVAAVFSHLRAMMEVVGIGFRYFFRSPIEGSSVDAVYVTKRADFDMEVFINSGADPEVVDNFFERLDLHVRAMRLGGRIIGKLWSLIQRAIRASRAVVTWLGMILILMKFGNWLRRMVDLARESRELIAEFRALASE